MVRGWNHEQTAAKFDIYCDEKLIINYGENWTANYDTKLTLYANLHGQMAGCWAGIISEPLRNLTIWLFITIQS